MVTGRELSKIKQKIRALKDRDQREREHLKLKETARALESDHAHRHMGAMERGLRGLPSQIKRDVKALQKTATSPSAKKKYKKIEKLLGKI